MNEHKQTIDQLDTPVLLLDYKKLRANLNRIATFATETKVNWRPHIKTHKCIEIAKQQMEMGAVGITVAKLSEAEVMAKAGIADILIAFPLVSSQKLERLVHLLSICDVKIAVDSVEQVDLLQHFLENRISKPLEVWIKVNSGLNRCGVEPGRDVLELAKKINTKSLLHLNGIFTHAGHSYGATSQQQIKEIAIQEAKVILDSVKLCEQEGIHIEVKSVGSTPTYRIAGAIPGITEIRPGNAVFFDAIQSGLGVTSLSECALTVMASVVSIKENRFVIDTGSKALSLDQGAHGHSSVQGFGHISDHPELLFERLSEEHGIVSHNGPINVKLTDKLEIIPNHACTVVNLFDQIIVHKDRKVIGKWKVAARGCMQ